MMISGVSVDEKAFPMSWHSSKPDRPRVWRDSGMRSSPPPKMYEPAGVPLAVEGLSKLQIDMKAPPGTERKVSRSRAPSVASSVTSMNSPRNIEMTDATVEMMVRTIEEQQQQALTHSKEIMAKMEEVKLVTKREDELRRFVEQCTAASHEMWAKNQSMQEQNVKLKEKLQALRQLLQTRKSGV